MKLIKAYLHYLKERFIHQFIKRDYIPYSIKWVRGEKWLVDSNGLQCLECLYLQDIRRYRENGPITPGKEVRGYYFTEEDERHSPTCSRKK